MPEGLSEERAREYQAELKDKMQKSNPSEISDKMDLTLSIRRKDINYSTPELLL